MHPHRGLIRSAVLQGFPVRPTHYHTLTLNVKIKPTQIGINAVTGGRTDDGHTITACTVQEVTSSGRR